MSIRTSHTHPLRIDSVRTPGGGRIGLSLCPGKHQTGARTGDWQRDLETDLQVIRNWGATAVVTLMETPELARFGVAQLGETVEALGLDWYHLPIRDVQPPGPGFERRWVLYGTRLRQRLRSGENVLIHCLGGLGRSGTVAARLLVELGFEPPLALAAVRAVRPGAVETADQEAYVRALRPLHWNDAFLDRALGCVLGGALGDAFGYPIEFHRLEQIRQQFGPAGLCEPRVTDDQFQVSDDTQMTLFTLEGLARAGRGTGDAALIDSLTHAYADWLDTQSWGPVSAHCRGLLATRPALRQRRAPGNTCLSALQSGRPGTPEQPINDSKGCGAVMRVAPLGWIEPADPRHRFEQAARAGALTHGHPDGWAGGGLLAVLIGELHAGATFTEALTRAKTVTVQTLHARGIQADLLDCIERAEQLAGTDQSPPSAIAQLGHGWVGEEALAIALYAVQRADSFTEAVRHAANHDGDSDSTASIAGQIWGAWAGLAALPMSWVRRLDVLDEALDLIGALAEQGYRAEPVAGTDAPLRALS